ncbi:MULTISPECIES: DUF5330 domain-containing protein [unclassified Mesorhizobium]|uniref:DUF5330 domain-containing protein n=1 Tax=unclassified Mesorhizobium TaxID=325217 RepID=UPI0008F16F73|nr:MULTISPECIES: DUF5330 domain-containing protein [unclassified Mesorhizobium]RJG45909.1 hypothetical protein D3Y55_17740 [Mesorhizobium sp. DCY119]SFT96447.1 hypothetical protein SAMN05518861_108148 [Mesorhizobium sp. YR577]
MGFLIKMAFWFSLVLLVLPFDFGETKSDQPNVNAIQAFLAAREAVGDVSGICERKPEVCEVGKSAMHTVGIRAREAAKIAFEMLDSKFGEPDTATKTGSVPPVAPEAPAAN